MQKGVSDSLMTQAPPIRDGFAKVFFGVAKLERGS